MSTQSIKSYITLFKIRFINRLQYRVAAWAGLATQFAWGFMNLLLFHAFYAENPANFPMTFGQFAAYTWLQQALLALFGTWFWDNGIFDDIMSGNIAYEVARPVDLYNMWVVRNMATRISSVVLRCIPVLLVAFLLPEPFRLMLPKDILTFSLFILSSVFSFILVNTYCMFYYIVGFYVINSSGIRMIANSLAGILSGFIIPLPFFPEKILNVVNLLPFASMQNLPFFIYSGYISERDAVFKTGVQILWIIVFYIAGRLLMKKALKKVIVQGG